MSAASRLNSAASASSRALRSRACVSPPAVSLPQQVLYLLPLPQGHGPFLAVLTMSSMPVSIFEAHYGKMTHREQDSRAQLVTLHARLLDWLVNDAYPLWARYGIDPHNGGFFEALGQDCLGLPLPRRARVHPRQVYAFAQGRAFGWTREVTGIVSRGMEFFTAHYRRDDGLFRALAAVDGTVLDDRALLYDQAFALLGLAAAAAGLASRDAIG